MKRIFLVLGLVLLLSPFLSAKEQTVVKLKNPQLNKGLPVMKALAERKSTRDFSAKELDIQTLSNLLWAANGVNRKNGKRTAPSAMNRQEIDVYACLKDGVYLYNPNENILKPVSTGDCRLLGAPVTLLLISNSEEDTGWAAIDTGIVSQNISLFAAGMGLVTVPRGSMPKNDFEEMLELKEDQHIMLNHPIGYAKEAKNSKEKNND